MRHSTARRGRVNGRDARALFRVHGELLANPLAGRRSGETRVDQRLFAFGFGVSPTRI